MSEKKLSFSQRLVACRYASRRGFLRTLKYQLLNYFGNYRAYKKIDWSRVDRLVFVCKGNICRSAYAESVAESMGCNTASFGLDTIHDCPADDDAIRIAAEKGCDLSQHRTTSVKKVSLKDNDLLIAMEPWQVDELKSMYSSITSCQFTLLGLWSQSDLPHLQDPYGAKKCYFRRCFSIIESAVNRLARNIST